MYLIRKKHWFFQCFLCVIFDNKEEYFENNTQKYIFYEIKIKWLLKNIVCKNSLINVIFYVKKNAMFKNKEMLIFKCFLKIEMLVKVVQVGRWHGSVTYPTNLYSFLEFID